MEVGGRGSGGPAPGWTQVRSLQRSHSSIFGQGPGLDGWPPEDGQLVRKATQEGGQAGSVNGEALLTRSPQLQDIQAAQSYKLQNWFLDQSQLYILLEPPIEAGGLKKKNGITSLPPIYRNPLSQGHALKSSRNESPLFPEPLRPLHIELQSERYQECLTSAEASFLEQNENY